VVVMSSTVETEKLYCSYTCVTPAGGGVTLVSHLLAGGGGHEFDGGDRKVVL
jgi:hypothetical protein